MNRHPFPAFCAAPTFPAARRALAAACLALAATTPLTTAHAAITVYTTPASFNTATAQRFTDSFNDLALDYTASPLSRTNGPYRYTITAEGGLYAAGTAADTWLSTNFSNTGITFAGFTPALRAVGGLFFGSDTSGAFLAGQTLTFSATDIGGATSSYTLANATASSFVGFVSTVALTSLTVSINNPSVSAFVTVNDLVMSQAAVPEPATALLLLAGAAGLTAWRRRRGMH